MTQNKELRLYDPAMIAVTPSFVFQYKPDIGSFDTVDPCLINRGKNKNKEFHQMKLSSASAGSDLTVSSLRPDDFIGCGSGLKAGYVIRQKGSTSGECWV
jgi:hypothetical protein